MSRLRAWALIVVVVLAAAALAVATLRGAGVPLSLDDRAHQVASTLRCPVCLNLSVADSPSAVAQEMRRQIRQELQAGMTPDQIRAQFVASYGEWILLAPPRRGLTLVAWIGPPLLALIAGLATFLTVRRWATPRSGEPAGSEPLSQHDRDLLARELARPEKP